MKPETANKWRGANKRGGLQQSAVFGNRTYQALCHLVIAETTAATNQCGNRISRRAAIEGGPSATRLWQIREA